MFNSLENCFFNALKCDFDTLIFEKVPTVDPPPTPSPRTPIIPHPNPENKSTRMTLGYVFEEAETK